MTPASPESSGAGLLLLLGDVASRPPGLERALARGGFRVLEADDPRTVGDVALSALVITAPDAGPAFADALDAAGYAFGPAVPRLALLGASDRAEATRALGLGADDAVLSPVHFPELVARLAALARQAGRAGRRAAVAPALAEALDLAGDISRAVRAEEILDQLVRRVARSLDLARCSFVLTPPGRRSGRVIADFERVPARDLVLDFDRYPELEEAARTGRPVIVDDAQTDPRYHELRLRWARNRPRAPLHSLAALPVELLGRVAGVFLLRPRNPRSRLSASQLSFAGSLIRAAAAALERTTPGAVADPAGGGSGAALEERIREEFARARRYALGFSLAFLDVDGFRALTDRVGPEAGNRVLAAIGGALRNGARLPDFVSRHGADEFVVLMPETGVEGARRSVTRMRERIRLTEFPELAAGERPLVAAGIVGYPHPSVDPSDLLALGEAALIRAKGQTVERTAVVEYPPD